MSKFINFLAPPPINVPEQYDGWQLRWKFMVFRPALLKNELCLILGFLFYVAFFWWGSSVNANKAKKWISKHLSIYDQQFSQPNPKGLTTDGHTDFFVFSTGRRNVTSLHTIFRLRPRHDLLQYILQTAWKLVDLQYRPVDDLQLDFTLAPGAVQDSFVFAVVAKNDLSSVKNGRWDLTFTKTSENPALPTTLSVMSEYADITENILIKPLGNFNLAAVLQDPKILPYFRSLSITDQPRERPTSPIPTDDREKHVILTLRLPDPSEVEQTVHLINSTFHLIDSLHKLSLRPETKTKLRKTREVFDKTLKEESVREKKEEEEEAKAARKKRAEEERISKLSPAEQRKELEREKKRMIRKSQKVVRK